MTISSLQTIASVIRCLAAFIAGACLIHADAFAVDPPHNGRNSPGTSMSCEACHYSTTGPTPSWATQQTTTDETFFNNLCISCHNASAMTDSRFAVVRTHSSGNTSTKYGNWTIECRVCHNPHYQDQVSGYPADPDADLVTGTIGFFVQPPLSATETTIPIVGEALVVDAWIDHAFVPNTAYPTKIYRIKSNTVDAVTVHGPVNGRYAAAGSTYAIRFGKMVLGQVPTPYTGQRQVKFFRESGNRSFATSTDPLDMTSICQVCHENTTSFNSRGDLEGPGHPSLQAGGNCTQCHNHASGFRQECGSCHGNPPIVSTQGGPNGLANNEGGTGSTTPGAHGKHAISAGIACDSCHDNGMPSTPIYDKLIQIGFNIAYGMYQSGSFDGRTTLANGYSYSKGNPGTTVTRSGTKVCSNVYCHGSTMAPNGGSDITPAWDVPSTGACGACHGATAAVPPVRGNHYKHTRTDLLGYAYPCATCHRDPAGDASLHVNGRSEVVFSGLSASGGSYTGTPAMLDAYGSCTNIYCHSTVQSSPPGGPPVYRVTPVWGDEIWSCGACHDYAADLDTGSHGKHMEYAELQECWACHNYTGIDDGCMACHDPDSIEPKRDMHANHAIDVFLTPRYGGNYSGTPAPDDAYGSCANTYCHGKYSGSGKNATPAWGNAGSGACGTCHGAVNATGSGPSSGSHVIHTEAGPLIGYFYTCTLCHKDLVTQTGPTSHAIADTTRHVNGVTDWKFDTTVIPFSTSASYSIASGSSPPSDGSIRSYGGCSQVYCHSNVQDPISGVGGPTVYGSPMWGVTDAVTCSTYCHGGDHQGAPPPTGSHVTHLSYTFAGLSSVRKCGVCHKFYAAASIASGCGLCHLPHTPVGAARHVNFAVEVEVDATFGSVTSYNGTPQPGDGYGSCTNVYCHSNGTLVASGAVPSNTSTAWGSGVLACAACHGNPPSYANGSPKANSHASASHIGSACSDCHYATTATGTTITDKTMHVNRAYEVTPNTAASISFTYTYAPTGGTCTSVSCHAGGATRTWGQ